MGRYLRDPQNNPAPEGIEPRRLKIYEDLVYKNIEGFISGGFPVLRSLYTDDDLHGLVRIFIDQHRCHTPYFLEISQEFLRFLTEEYQLRESDPLFIAELAHYEWVELALDVSLEDLANVTELHDPVLEVPTLSPLAWLLSYQFPVHKIGKSFQPSEAVEPTFLVVYRNPKDDVCFMELNPATARLLELIRDNTGATGASLLAQLSEELGMPSETVAEFGGELLSQLCTQSIICAA